jgi:hypothetical protein
MGQNNLLVFVRVFDFAEILIGDKFKSQGAFDFSELDFLVSESQVDCVDLGFE